MQFKVDFNELPKSKYRYYFGIALMLISVLLFFYSIYEFSIFFILYSLFLFIMSFTHAYEGNGKSINSLFGERFIEVNDKFIELKLKSREKSIVIYWDSVESIKFDTTKFVINSKEMRKTEIEYSKLSYTTVQKLKETLATIEQQKLGSKL